VVVIGTGGLGAPSLGFLSLDLSSSPPVGLSPDAAPPPGMNGLVF